MTGKPPRPPAQLSATAKSRWRQVAAGLARRGPVDVELLTAYCQLWARWRSTEAAIGETPPLVRNAKGRAVPNPLLAIAKDAAQQLRALEGRLGIAAAAPAAQVESTANASAELLTRRQLAERFDVVMMTVTKWEQDGMPVAVRGRKGKPSLYRELEVRGWLAQREQKAQTSDPAVSVAVARARKEQAQAMEAEQRYQQRARQLLPADEVAHVWSLQVAGIRARLLALPGISADRLERAYTLDGRPGLDRELEAVVHELLVELAEGGDGTPPDQAPE